MNALPLRASVPGPNSRHECAQSATNVGLASGYSLSTKLNEIQAQKENKFSVRRYKHTNTQLFVDRTQSIDDEVLGLGLYLGSLTHADQVQARKDDALAVQRECVSAYEIFSALPRESAPSPQRHAVCMDNHKAVRRPQQVRYLNVRCRVQMLSSHATSRHLRSVKAQDVAAKPYCSRFERLYNIPQQFFELVESEWPTFKRKMLKRRRDNDGKDILDQQTFYSTSDVGYNANALLVHHKAVRDSERVVQNGSRFIDEECLSLAELHARWEHHLCGIRGCPRDSSTALVHGLCEAHYKQYARRRAPVRAKFVADQVQLFHVRSRLLRIDRNTGADTMGVFESQINSSR